MNNLPIKNKADLALLIQALENGTQADADGVFVKVSRQAIEDAATELRTLAAQAEQGGGELHPKTAEYLNKFFQAMAEKLRAAEKKYGYRDGWLTQDWEDECHHHMHDHIAKGDPRDVANYCMFMWARGWATKISPSEEANKGYVKHLAETRDALIEELRKAKATPPPAPDVWGLLEDMPAGTLIGKPIEKNEIRDTTEFLMNRVAFSYMEGDISSGEKFRRATQIIRRLNARISAALAGRGK